MKHLLFRLFLLSSLHPSVPFTPKLVTTIPAALRESSMVRSIPDALTIHTPVMRPARLRTSLSLAQWASTACAGAYSQFAHA